MESTKQKSTREHERGNVLFLILIAVALFAALSYAVTQSTRGGGNADDETSLISSASLTQYPASLKTSILRMSISGGIGDDELMFNPPSDIDNCEDIDPDACVFGSSGGSASHQNAPNDVVTSGSSGAWVFNGENSVHNIGSNPSTEATPTSADVEVIAFLPNVRDGICNKIHEELGIGAPPTETGIDVTTYQDGDGSNPLGVVSADGDTIGASGGSVLNGQSFGCFVQGGVNYYYHVLSEN